MIVCNALGLIRARNWSSHSIIDLIIINYYDLVYA